MPLDIQKIAIDRHRRMFEDSVKDIRRILHERYDASLKEDNSFRSQELFYQADAGEIVIEGMRYNERLLLKAFAGEHYELAAAASGIASAIATIIADFVKTHHIKADTPEEGAILALEGLLDTIRKGVTAQITGKLEEGYEPPIEIIKYGEDYSRG